AQLARERFDVARDASRIGPGVRREQRDPHTATLPAGGAGRRPAAAIIAHVSARHFVKYTFLKLDPAWRRLPDEQREQDKREFIAACEDFADGHMLQSFSLVGTRGDAELMLLAEAENLERIHEFHVVLAQSGLMKWSEISHSFLGMRK